MIGVRGLAYLRNVKITRLKLFRKNDRYCRAEIILPAEYEGYEVVAIIILPSEEDVVKKVGLISLDA